MTMLGKQAAIDFNTYTAGAKNNVGSRKFIVPALRYNNKNPRGMNYIKFDGFEVCSTGKVLLIDSKTNLPSWNKEALKKIDYTLDRLKQALQENPEYKVVYEFPSYDKTTKTTAFLRKINKRNIIEVRTRGK